MATLFNTKISATYEGLLKTIDNAAISATLKELTDGSGNQSGLYLNTAGDFKVTNVLEWGSLKDTGTGVTITRYVTSTDGLENFDNNTSLPTSASVKLYVDTKFATSDNLQEVLSFGNTTSGNNIVVSASDDITFTDSSKALFGSSQDLEINHNGTDSFVTDLGTGDLRLRSDNSVKIQASTGGNNLATFTKGSGVDLYFNNAKKLETTNTGISVTGIISNLTNPIDAQDAATKSYVDALDAGSDLDITDGTNTGDVNLNTQTLSILGTDNEIETVVSGQGVTISLPSSISTDLVGNVTGNLTGNVAGDLTGNVTSTSVLANGVTATTQASTDSSTKVATTAYVKGLDNASDLDFSGDSGTGDVNLNAQTFAITGTANQIESSASNQGLSLQFPSAGVTLPNGSVATTQSADDNSTKIATTSYVDTSAALYLPLVGGIMSGNTIHNDSIKSIYGTGSDAQVYHDGSNFYTNNSTGQLNIDQSAVTESIVFKTSDANALDTTALIINRGGDLITGRDVTIAGDLTVNGTTTTVNSQTLSVDDPLISLAINNAANSLDIGYYGKYNDGTTRYLGLYNDASDSNKFKLFKGTTVEPTTTVNIGAAGYAAADLELANLVATGNVTGTTFIGNLTGDVTGNLQGNVTGDVTGNVTGNLTGTVNSTSVLANGVTSTTQTAGDNSTKVATTAYANAAASAIPIGDYLPLIGGTLTGPLTGTSGSFSSSVSATDGNFSGNVDVTGIARANSLTIDGGSNRYLYILSSDGNGECEVRLGDNLDSDAGSIAYNNADNSMTFRTNAATALRLNSDKSATFAGTTTVQGTGDSSFVGNVGIGTATFDATYDAKLQVTSSASDGTGGILIENYLPTLTLLDISGGASASQLQQDGTNMVFKNSGSEKMRIDSDGNVGIGTASPSVKLQVKKAIEGNETLLGIEASGAGTTVLGSITYDQSADTMRLLNNSTFADTSLRLGTQGNDNLVIDSAGNVGIGTDSPDAKLEVIGETRISYAPSNQYRVRITNSDGNGRILVDGDTSSLIFGTSGAGANATATERMRITSTGDVNIKGNNTKLGWERTSDGASNIAYLTKTQTISTNGEAKLHGYDGVIFTTAGSETERMRITSGGTVQVGATTGYTTINQGAFFTKGGGDMYTANLLAGASVSPMFKLQRNDVEKYNIGLDGNDNLAFINASGDAKVSITSGGTLQLKGQTPIQSFLSAKALDTDLGGTILSTIEFRKHYAINRGASISMVQPDGVNQLYNADLAFYTNPNNAGDSLTERMRITSGGTVGIGTTGAYSSTLDLNLSGKGLSLKNNVNGSNNNWSNIRNTAILSQSNLVFDTGGVLNALTLDHNGNVLIGVPSITDATSRGYGNAFSGSGSNGNWTSWGSGSHTHAIFRNGTNIVGTITTNTTTTTYNTTSDYRLKEDLQDFAGLDMVSKIPVYDYKWKSDESRSYGVMAHELQEVLPDAVSGEKDAEEMQGVDYSKIVPVLVKAIQELKAEIELLKAK